LCCGFDDVKFGDTKIFQFCFPDSGGGADVVHPLLTGAHGREMMDVTIRQTVRAQCFIIVIEKATCFGCTRQPSGFVFQKYKKEVHIAIAIHTTVKT
jgi:hypothetical protein